MIVGSVAIFLVMKRSLVLLDSLVCGLIHGVTVDDHAFIQATSRRRVMNPRVAFGPNPIMHAQQAKEVLKLLYV